MSTTNNSNGNNNQLVFWGKIIGAMAIIIVAVIGLGDPLVQWIVTFLSPPETFPVALVNNHCVDQDYYVDNTLVASVKAEDKTAFMSTRGTHYVRACNAGTNSCSDLNQVTWRSATERQISRGMNCPVTITLINDHCLTQDYYVDGEIVTTIGGNQKKIFEVKAGEHQVKACYPETNRCSEVSQVNWTVSTERRISRGSSCPITVTIINEHCEPQDYHVDGELAVSLEAGEKASFEVEIGQHDVVACYAETKNCSEENSVYFSEDTIRSISRGSICTSEE